jgi:hypothetical protein
MLDSIIEVAYKCDLCGELFNSPDDAQDHNQKDHPKFESKDEFGSWVMGTSTMSEDSNAVFEKKEIAKDALNPITKVDSELDKELLEWSWINKRRTQDLQGN